MATRPQSSDYATHLVRRHLLIGWTGLLVFLCLGIALETLHGLKAGYYLDPKNSTRRLVWTLAHTHGTLFALVNLALAFSIPRAGHIPKPPLRVASIGLTGALVTMPLGFFLGGVRIFAGDPGLGILLVPVGAAFLLVGVGAFLWALRRGIGPG